MHAEGFFSYNVAKPTRLNNPVRWGVKNSFFTKRILLFINNLQIFGKTGIFVPVLAFQKQIGIRFLPTVEMTTMLGQGLGRGKADAKRPLFPSQLPRQGRCHFDGAKRLRNLFYDNVLNN